ncbi:MAG TPA: HAD hydrolase-like protein [Clostridia bacterium]|jgi:phosphoglycolate phosphatase|nr:MAG: 5'-nucleotidase [Firmicutes bacterium ADurb.Bin099]HNZ40778.1 HAD hydrolase-like protein [Clostridia bacterium]HPY98221.1 HAD hydrolase-like protein [Clostridia bacterium]HQC67771.1 HAD hydrolase-like protein [Clostridia bacterium]
MRYTLCLFDLDGTLTDPKIGITKSFQYALSYFGIHEELDNLTNFIGPPLRESFKNSYGFSDTDTEKAVAKYREYFTATGLYENAVYPKIPETLEKLKNNGCILAVATSKVTAYAKKILKHFNLDGYFTLVSGDEMDGSLTKNGKHALINIALDRLDPERTLSVVMIGDRKDDIIGANNAGIDSIGVLWGYGTVEELETANATKIVHTSDELYSLIIEECR